MQTEIKTLLDAIIADYARWQQNGRDSEIKQAMFAEFCQGLRVEEGRKYIKIIQRNSVWGFIVKGDDDKKFRKGDILKPVSRATPARNKARGNILDGDYTVKWTGPLYLK